MESPGIGRRLACFAYDGILVLGILAVGWLLPHALIGMGFHSTLPPWLLLAHVFLLLGSYFIWCWHRSGQTLAMQTWKIILTSTTAEAPPLSRLALRYVFAWPSICCFGIGLFWAVFDKDHQFLHDRIAGTRLRLRRN